MDGSIMHEGHERRDVVILGAGIAGMTAAHRLREQDLVVLEAEPRVGGRTLSGGDNDAWFNLGAQLISSERMAALCRELGIELISVSGSDFGFAVNGHFARGATPQLLLARMRISPTQKLDFALTAVRLRRKLHALQRMSAEQRAEIDGQTLQRLMGRVSPVTMELLETCCESASGSTPYSMSGLYGLAYGLGLFLDPVTKQGLYGVRGGTQQVANTIAAGLPAGALRLGATVTSVRQPGGEEVVVTYRGLGGDEQTISARHSNCALPAHAVLEVVEGVSPEKRAALEAATPYTTTVSVAWAVPDGVSTPWDGVFIAPAARFGTFNLITNYGYLAQQLDPRRGGYLNVVASNTSALPDVDDERFVALQHAELVRLFPAAAQLLDPQRAVIQRWPQMALPRIREGFLSRRGALRADEGNVCFCGDYTSEPGLPGANNSGHHAGEAVVRELAALPAT